MLLHLFLLFGSSAAVIVNTKYGKVKGYPFITRNQHQVWSFSGIRYATPPLDHLRFKDPLPPKPHEGIRDVKYSTPCYSKVDLKNLSLFPAKPGEDCLHLAVYSPLLNPKRRYPVMVWVHGGGWVAGAGQSMYGAQYFMDYNIVVVLVEFRLDVLGFLTTENEVLPGNMQLKDQVLALKWVQENIAAFGGDPNKVTLMGHSAGAAAVSHHMKSPMSRGLFHAAICESGTSTAPWSVLPPGYGKFLAAEYASLVNCPSSNDRELLHCLQKKSISELYNVSIPVPGPVIDSYSSNPFMPTNPHHTQSEPIPLITGVNNLDGFVVTGSLYDSKIMGYLLDQLKKSGNSGIQNIFGSVSSLQPYFFFLAMSCCFFNPITSALLLFYYKGSNIDMESLFEFYKNPEKYDDILNQVKQFYFKQQITDQSLANLTNMISDRHFFWPLLQELNLHPGPAYVYNLAYNNTRLQTHGLTGSEHGETPIYLWKVADHTLDERAKRLSERLVKIFVNFIIHKTPTPPGSSSVHWPRWDNAVQPFLTIDTCGNFRQDHGFYTDRMQFWQKMHNLQPDIDE